MTDTQNPYREAIEKLDFVEAQNDGEHVGRTLEDCGAYDTILLALQIAAILHDNREALQGLIDAGEKATGGEWSSREDKLRPAYGTIKCYEAKETICDARNKNGKVNRGFIAQAANTRPIFKQLMKGLGDGK